MYNEAAQKVGGGLQPTDLTARCPPFIARQNNQQRAARKLCVSHSAQYYQDQSIICDLCTPTVIHVCRDSLIPGSWSGLATRTTLTQRDEPAVTSMTIPETKPFLMLFVDTMHSNNYDNKLKEDSEDNDDGGADQEDRGSWRQEVAAAAAVTVDQPKRTTATTLEHYQCLCLPVSCCLSALTE